MKKRLVETEKKVRDYRQRYMGELPEQLETNLRVIDRLQMQLNEKQISMRDERNRLTILENQIKESQQLAGIGEGPLDVETSTDLNRLRLKLEDMRSRYTDSHPDVIRLKNRILVEIKNLESEINKIIKDINFYQQRVEKTPRREEELSSLMRDYKLIQDSYNSLLNRKLEAEIAVNMERKQKGEQFRILDSARSPNKPVSPDMKKLFLIVTFAGLSIGCGLVLLLDYLDTSLRQPEEYEAELEIPVIATIPRVLHPSDIRGQRFNFAFSVFSIMIAGVLFAGFAVLTIIKGVDPTLEYVRRFVSI
jgi:uncharacterized protein involved in exopolysaccharide biosynthesis